MQKNGNILKQLHINRNGKVFKIFDSAERKNLRPSSGGTPKCGGTANIMPMTFDTTNTIGRNNNRKIWKSSTSRYWEIYTRRMPYSRKIWSKDTSLFGTIVWYPLYWKAMQSKCWNWFTKGNWSTSAVYVRRNNKVCLTCMVINVFM